MDDTKLVESAKKIAAGFFNEKRANCAESVFRAIHGLVDTDLPEEVSSLMTPLGGGVGVRGENCGAMLAGASALGLVYGRRDPYADSLEQQRGRLWDTYSLFNQLPHRFHEKFGSVNCWNLTKGNVYGTERSRRRCETIVAETAAMVMELLLEAKRRGIPFEFKENILSQAAAVTGLSVEKLIEHKKAGQPIPLPPEDA